MAPLRLHCCVVSGFAGCSKPIDPESNVPAYDPAAGVLVAAIGLGIRHHRAASSQENHSGGSGTPT